MKNIFIVLTSLLVLALYSCSVEPVEIDYGNVHCMHCDMTVVDRNHSAEYVTTKGKAFVFDAIECMVRTINEKNNESDLAFILVADYANPGTLIDVNSATFMINENIKSPMGANLSAFSTYELAKNVQDKQGGALYHWDELKAELAE